MAQYTGGWCCIRLTQMKWFNEYGFARKEYWNHWETYHNVVSQPDDVFDVIWPILWLWKRLTKHNVNTIILVLLGGNHGKVTVSNLSLIWGKDTNKQLIREAVKHISNRFELTTAQWPLFVKGNQSIEREGRELHWTSSRTYDNEKST